MKCGFLLGGIGTLIGTVVALASTRLLSRILYGVSATDMSTFISAFFVLLLLVGLATLMPGIAGLTNKRGGRVAASIDPDFKLLNSLLIADCPLLT